MNTSSQSNEKERIVELSERIDRAIHSLAEIRSGNFTYGDEGYKRLTAKIEGVALVGAYVDEMLRTFPLGKNLQDDHLKGGA